MFFGELPLSECLGCYLAHSQLTTSGRVRKGSLIDTELLQQFIDDGVVSIIVAKPDADDVHENDAAATLACALASKGIRKGKAKTGRVNLYATETGLLLFDPQQINDINSVDQGITLATLTENQWVQKGRMVATIKIIPYAVAQQKLQQTTDLCASTTSEPARNLSVHKPQPANAVLVQTTLPGTSSTMLDKTTEVSRQRLLHRHSTLTGEVRCDHSIDTLASSLKTLTGRQLAGNHPGKDTLSEANDSQPPDWILIVGASAISDEADIIPQAIKAAGGKVNRYGLPVDPGNLLLLGELENSIVLGMPGCARSPKYNGLDQVLDRMACRVPLTDRWLNSLGVGGLLGEILERPSPRVAASAIAPDGTTEEERQPQQSANSANTGYSHPPASLAEKTQTGKPKIAGVLLAAGTSQRFGDDNKLLAKFAKQTPTKKTRAPKALASHALQHLLSAGLERIVVVTGYQSDLLERTLRQENELSGQNSQVEFLHNPLYKSGMASSIVAAVSTLNRYDAVVISLADMPQLDTVVDTLASQWHQHPDKTAFVPTHNKRRGNPVLITRSLFDNLLMLEGDTGARHLLNDNAAAVHEVEFDSPGILIDYDTPEQLAKAISQDS